MSIFGDLETPEAKRRPPGKKAETPPLKPVGNLSLTVHKAVLDEVRGRVHLSASARTGFADGTAGSGVPVSFFLNGKLLRTIDTDEFGLASLEHGFDASLLKYRQELIAQVRGFATEAHSCVSARRSQLEVTEIRQGWVDESVVRCTWLRYPEEVHSESKEYLFGLLKEHKSVLGFRVPRKRNEWASFRVSRRLLISARLAFEDAELSTEELVIDVLGRREGRNENVLLGTGRVGANGEFQCTCDSCYLADEWFGASTWGQRLVRNNESDMLYLLSVEKTLEFLLSSSSKFEEVEWPRSWRLFAREKDLREFMAPRVIKEGLIVDFQEAFELMPLSTWPTVEPQVILQLRCAGTHCKQVLQVDGTSRKRLLRMEPGTPDKTPR